MIVNQKGFGSIKVLIIMVLTGVVGLGGWYIWQSRDNKSTFSNSSQSQSIQQASSTTGTPRKNKEIEILAAQEKNPSKCNEIKGESFFYGPRDEKITISETEAKKQCRENIEKGIVPVLFGG